MRPHVAAVGRSSLRSLWCLGSLGCTLLLLGCLWVTSNVLHSVARYYGRLFLDEVQDLSLGLHVIPGGAFSPAFRGCTLL